MTAALRAVEGCTAPEVCAALLDRLVARRHAGWVSVTAAADSGTRVRGRYVDSAVHDLAVQAVRGYAVRAGTADGLLFAADVDPRLGLVDELGRPGASGPAAVLSTVDDWAVPELAGLRAWLAAADEAARSWDPAVCQLVIDFEVVERTAWIGVPGAGVVGDDRGLAYVELRAIAGDPVSTGRHTVGVAGPLALIDPVLAGREVARRAVHALSAGPAPAGQCSVVIAGGHGIPLRPSESAVSIVDDPTMPDAIGSYRIDDEGVPAQRTALPAGVLTDRDTAHRLGAPLSGNGRCESALHPPQPRSSNLCVAPGTLSRAEIIADTAYGIYAAAVEAVGASTLRVTSGYLIENGKVGDPIRETILSGSLSAGIDAVGNDPAAGATSPAAAGQRVPVGVVSPTLRVRSLRVASRVGPPVGPPVDPPRPGRSAR
jgi:TldD protein